MAQLAKNYNKLTVIFSSNFPYRYHKNLAKLVVLQFLLVFLFLYLFRPFGYDPDKHYFNYAVTCLFQACSPALIVYCYFLILNRSNKGAVALRWTLGLQLLHLILVLFLIGLASFFLRTLIYKGTNHLSWSNLVTELKNVYLAGSLFVVYLLAFGNKNTSKPLIKASPCSIPIKTETKKDDFTLHSEHFVYAKSEGNYIDLYTKDQELLKKDLKRISLKNLNAQLKQNPQFVRCHRAYLVNTNHIVKITGNAQGYLLSVNGAAEKIPVSRTYLPVFEPLLINLKKDQ